MRLVESNVRFFSKYDSALQNAESPFDVPHKMRRETQNDQPNGKGQPNGGVQIEKPSYETLAHLGCFVRVPRSAEHGIDKAFDHDIRSGWHSECPEHPDPSKYFIKLLAVF